MTSIAIPRAASVGDKVEGVENKLLLSDATIIFVVTATIETADGTAAVAATDAVAALAATAAIAATATTAAACRRKKRKYQTNTGMTQTTLVLDLPELVVLILFFLLGIFPRP